MLCSSWATGVPCKSSTRNDYNQWGHSLTDKLPAPPSGFVALELCVRPRQLGSWLAAACSSCDQTSQALRDDLPCLLHQLANDLTGRIDLPDRANALAR